MNDAALLDSLHAALRNPDLAWYTEFHAGESIVAGYLDSLTDPYDDDAIQVPEGWFRYSVVTREGDHALPWMEHWNEYEYSITHHIDWNGSCRRGLSRSRTCLWRTPMPKSGSHGKR